MRRSKNTIALKNNKIFFPATTRIVLTNSSSSTSPSSFEEEEEEEEEEDKIVITTNDDDEANAFGRKQYLSTMRKRNDVEEWLEKCDSLEFSLQLALAKEDYDLAAKIKKELEPNADDEDDINFSMLCDLCRRVSSPASSAITADDEVEAITMAAKKLGLVGDPRALPALSRALRVPVAENAKVHAQIEQSMWTLFGKSGDTELDLLLQKGSDIMHGRYVAPKLGEGEQNEEAEDGNSTEKSTNDKEKSSENEKIRNSLEQQAAERMRNLKRATTIFTSVIEKSNGLFAEAWNQRATALYLQGDFASAYADAEEAFRLNPYHFGARSGMGLCKFASRAYDEALVLFESTLEINPHIKSIQRYSKELRKAQASPRVERQKLTDALEDYKRSIAPSAESPQRKFDDPETPEN